jgi:hypothetical protein
MRIEGTKYAITAPSRIEGGWSVRGRNRQTTRANGGLGIEPFKPAYENFRCPLKGSSKNKDLS